MARKEKGFFRYDEVPARAQAHIKGREAHNALRGAMKDFEERVERIKERKQKAKGQLPTPEEIKAQELAKLAKLREAKDRGPTQKRKHPNLEKALVIPVERD